MTTQALPDTKEQLIERVCEMIRNGRMMVLGVVDDQQKLVISSMGIEPKRIPDALRHFAMHVEQEERSEAIEHAIASLPAHRRSLCPCCGQNVVVTREIPERALKRENSHAICVCTCGAFLIPYLSDERELQLRLMTEQEIIDLPDEIRNEIVKCAGTSKQRGGPSNEQPRRSSEDRRDGRSTTRADRDSRTHDVQTVLRGSALRADSSARESLRQSRVRASWRRKAGGVNEYACTSVAGLR